MSPGRVGRRWPHRVGVIRGRGGVSAPICSRWRVRTEPAEAPLHHYPRGMEGSDLFETVVNLCKRRGFVFPSAEIYGGFRSTYDHGPLGGIMLRNIREAWFRAMVRQRDDIVLIDAAVLTTPKV